MNLKSSDLLLSKNPTCHGSKTEMLEETLEISGNALVRHASGVVHEPSVSAIAIEVHPALVDMVTHILHKDSPQNFVGHCDLVSNNILVL